MSFEVLFAYSTVLSSFLDENPSRTYNRTGGRLKPLRAQLRQRLVWPLALDGARDKVKAWNEEKWCVQAL